MLVLLLLFTIQGVTFSQSAKELDSLRYWFNFSHLNFGDGKYKLAVEYKLKELALVDEIFNLNKSFIIDNDDIDSTTFRFSIYVSLSWIYLFKGDFVLSEKSSQMALSYKPNNLFASGNYAHSLLLQGKTNEAMSLYQKNIGKKMSDDLQIFWEAACLEDILLLENSGVADKVTTEPVKKLLKPFVKIIRENLGPNVNTYAHEFAPKISADGKLLTFAREGHNKNFNEFTKKRNEFGELIGEGQEAWMSELLPNGQWKQAANFGLNINVNGYNGVAAIFPDKNSILLMGTYDAGSKEFGQGYSTSTRTKAVGLPQKPLKSINITANLAISQKHFLQVEKY
ncbi:MAG: PD40 domain-containing protein [Ignavibacteria bacterium]|nr:PD40 domain-containing protein [Ignavibacteria bacterium]